MQDKPSRVPRLFVEPPLRAGETFVLPLEVAHHASGVLRQRPGDALVLFDGRGGEYAARIVSIERNRVSVSVEAWREVDRESPLEVALAQGISSGERMDFTIQKAVELGVAAIFPLACEKSVVRLSAERAAARLAHWKRVAIAACEQSGRNAVPRIEEPLSVAHYCARSSEQPASDSAQGILRLVLRPGAALTFKRAVPAGSGGVILACGPEAGFTVAEEGLLERAGFIATRIGPRVLRTETAALAALAALNALRGDF